MNPIVQGEVSSNKILIVDDDVPLVRGLKLALENQGYVVRAVNRGAQTLDAAVSFKPDLILLDVMMPGMDGWEVLGQIRAHPSTEQTPVIMLTAVDADASKIKGFSLGSDDYVTKPFNLQELRCRIAAVLRRSAPVTEEDSESSIPVVTGGSGFELIRRRDIHFVEGIRNYTYIHTFDSRYLSRLHLGAVEERQLPGFMRVHRSYIVNLEQVKGCGWTSKSAYHLRLGDLAGTEIPVSRTLISEVQQRLGLKS